MKGGDFLDRYGVPVLVALLFSVFFFFDIGGRHISSPDEGRYVEIAREMLGSGDYVLPRLNGVLYFEKPPLFYWLEGAAIGLLGISEWAVRLWPTLLGLFGCWMTYAVGRRFYGRNAGVVSAIVLATTLLYYLLARLVVIDMAVSTFMTAALFAFLLSAEEDDERRAIRWARAGHVAAALAVLSKGLIGVLLPGLVGLVWIAALGRWTFVRRALCPSGILLFLAIAVPWHVLAAMRNDDFLWFYFVHEHLMRFTTDVHRRVEPFWYFLAVIAVGFLPWTGYLWHAVREALPASWSARRDRPVELFLLIWVTVVFLFFSISSSKLPPYILPVFPPLALLVGRALAPRLEAVRADGLAVGRFVFAGVFGLLGFAVLVAYRLPALRSDANVGLHLDAVAPIVFAMAAVFILAAAVALLSARRFGARAGFAAALVAATIGWSGVSLIASEADPNSVKPIAEAIGAHRHNGERVASFGTFFYDLPVYIDDKVIVVDNTAEFDFGLTQEDVSRNVMSAEEFSKLWNGRDLMFMVVRSRHFRKWEETGTPLPMCVLKRTARAVGVANRPLFDGEGRTICKPWHDAGPEFTRMP